MVNLLLKNSEKLAIDANQADQDGMTGLMHACKEKHELVVATFMRIARFHEINFNYKDPNGRTAFIWACRETEQTKEKRIKRRIVELFCSNAKRYKIDLNA